jgi:predicted Fe-S protein YdhL (DUF1289 family)
MDEITRWGRMSARDQWSVIERLAKSPAPLMGNSRLR